MLGSFQNLDISTFSGISQLCLPPSPDFFMISLFLACSEISTLHDNDSLFIICIHCAGGEDSGQINKYTA